MDTQKQIIQWQPLITVPGLVFRHFAGDADHQIRCDIANALKEANGMEHIITVEDIRNDEKWTTNYDITQQLIYVELGEKAIGYMGYSWQADINDNRFFYIFGNLLSEYWGKGIADLMLQYVEEKIHEAAASMPAEQDKAIRMWRNQSAREYVAFLQSHGYQIERYFFEMLRPITKPLPEVSFPAGVELREVKPEHYRAIWDADQEAFRDHWGYAEPTEEMFEAWQKDRLFQPHLWKVAWEGDQVCGMVRNFYDPQENEEYNRKRGYTEEISVRRPWRGKGVAKACIAESIKMFRDMGMEETVLNVDANNPNGALQLYQFMGYEVEEDKTGLMLSKNL